MHKRYSRFIYTIILSLFGTIVSASSETNVIVRVTKTSQQPAFGYNAVSELARVFSEEIHAGRVKLWSSANKELQIFPSTLVDIEKANDMPLADIDNLFVYELWKEDKKEVDVQPIGFLLATRNKRNTDFTYGFVEYNDVKGILANNNVEAAGVKNSSASSLEEVIETKKYVYSIIQYGSQTIVNATLSEKIKNDVFNKKAIAYKKTIVNSRSVIFTISRQADESIVKAENSNIALNAIQEYMRNNPEEFLTAGGDVLLSYINPETALININKIEVTGTWTKTVTGVDFKPLGITLFINSIPLQFIPIIRVNSWNINPGTLSLEQYIINRNYYYTVNKINNKIIKPEDEEQYRVLLNNGDWDKFME